MFLRKPFDHSFPHSLPYVARSGRLDFILPTRLVPPPQVRGAGASVLVSYVIIVLPERAQIKDGGTECVTYGHTEVMSSCLDLSTASPCVQVHPTTTPSRINFLRTNEAIHPYPQHVFQINGHCGALVPRFRRDTGIHSFHQLLCSR